MLALAAGATSAVESEEPPVDSRIKEIHAEIDRTVWRAFKAAFEALDGESLNDVYAPDVLRVTPEGVDTQNSFKASNLERFKANKTRGDSIKLDFWLDSRRSNEDISYNVGFYRIQIQTPGEAAAIHYGQFHIVLKKINGQWKIAQDWDTTSIAGVPIDAAVFERRAPDNF